MTRSNAEFRALMDMVGYTDRDVEFATGMAFDRDDVPDEAWQAVDAAYARQRAFLRGMVGLAIMDGKPVTLPYRLGGDVAVRKENANNRALASALVALGFNVSWEEGIPLGSDGADMTEIPEPTITEMGLQDAIRHVVGSTGKSQREMSLELGKRETWLNQAITRQKSIAANRVAYIANACGWTLRFRNRKTGECVELDPDGEE